MILKSHDAVMIEKIKTICLEKECHIGIVPASKVKLLSEEIRVFRKEHTFNQFQERIIDNMYNFDIPEKAQSLFMLAIPRPAYANLTFQFNGKEYKLLGNVASSASALKSIIAKSLEEKGFKIFNETMLPLKRLAVQSGLGAYGKNNLVYIKGAGCYFSLMGFYTDVACEEYDWRDVTSLKACETCGKCIEACPASALSADRFLLDTNKCFAFLSMQMGDISTEWISNAIYPTPYYCFSCQLCCPMNKSNPDTIDVLFNEEETGWVLNGEPYGDVSEEFKNKIMLLGFIGRAYVSNNLKLVFDLMDKGHAPII